MDTEKLAKFSSPRYMSENDDELVELVSEVPENFNNQEIPVLIDTGAGANCMPLETLKNICPNAEIVPGRKRLQAANKSKIKVFGIWKGNFEIGDISLSAKFYITQDLGSQVILGNPFLLKSKALIDYDSMSITFRNKSKRRSVKFGVFYKTHYPDQSSDACQRHGCRKHVFWSVFCAFSFTN